LTQFGGHRSKGGCGVDHGRGEKAEATRRSFTDEFKAGAVRLVLDEGKTVSQVARDLGLTASALRTWVERARADGTKRTTELTTEERVELMQLRKENRELWMEHHRTQSGKPLERLIG
jgi:transposase